MFIKNRHLQLLPDGTVNGTSDDTSDYTILQRTTVNIGQIKIQGAATCLYLCMDACGFPYSSKEFTLECVFNEMLEQHHYNTYSSSRHSGPKRTMYLALDARGRPRRVALPARRVLGKLFGYVRALTKIVEPNGTSTTCTRTATTFTTTPPHHPPRHGCRNKKRKKRKCKEGEKPGDHCDQGPPSQPKNHKKIAKCPEGQQCNRDHLSLKPNVSNTHARHKRPFKTKKFNKLQLQPPPPDQNAQAKKKRQKHVRNRKKVGRALDDIHNVPPTTTGSWEIEDEPWMSTSDEMFSSTQVEDVTHWELTTNSGFNREFFRTASAGQETVEEDDI